MKQRNGFLAIHPSRTGRPLQVRLAEADLDPCSLAFAQSFLVRRRGVEARLVIGAATPRPDRTLIRAVALSHAWLDELRGGASTISIARRLNCTDAMIRQRLPLAFLSPKITEAILAGRQPEDLTLTRLITSGIPSDWEAQWAELGFNGVP